jgi:hypothetical protein
MTDSVSDDQSPVWSETGSEDDFEAFKPIPSPDGETYWEHRPTLGYPLEQVWTVVSSDDGEDAIAAPGYHIVNKEGYLVTEIPWTDINQTYYWYKDGRTRYVITLEGGEEVYEVGEDEADVRERVEYIYDEKIVSIRVEE